MKRETTRQHISFLYVTCDGIPVSCVRSTSTSSMYQRDIPASCVRRTSTSNMQQKDVGLWTSTLGHEKTKRKMHGNRCKCGNGLNLSNHTCANPTGDGLFLCRARDIQPPRDTRGHVSKDHMREACVCLFVYSFDVRRTTNCKL